MSRPAGIASAFVLLGCSLAVGCGPDRGPQSWLGERSAVVRCTTSGPTRMPPALQGVPAPPAPTGLFARALDPMALDEMGYQRDRVVCAILQAPTAEEVVQTRTAVERFDETRKQASEAAIKEGGRCTCEVARELQIRQLVQGCLRVAPNPRCNTERARDRVEAAMAPAIQALPELPLPLRHWRLVGPGDRDGWFAEKYRDLLERHPGGSSVFLRGQPVDTDGNGPLISRLLDEDGVEAVVRQDGGRALLIVRELGGDLVLDHFEYPAPIPLALLPYFDNANPDVYLAQLGKPSETRALLLDPGKGNVVEFDRAQVEDVDSMAVVASILGPKPYAVDAADRAVVEPYVERVAFQAPFGRNGQELIAYAELNEAGVSWAQGRLDDRLTPTLEELALGEGPPAFTPPEDPKMPFLARGTDTFVAGIHGLRQVGTAMAAIERAHPGTVHGTGSAWEFRMPRNDLSALLGPGGPFAGVRELFTQKDYAVTMAFEKDRQVLTLKAAPR